MPVEPLLVATKSTTRSVGSVESAAQGLAYILVFGLGSIIGMSVLAVVISLPLRWSASRLTRAHNGLTLTFVPSASNPNPST